MDVTLLIAANTRARLKALARMGWGMGVIGGSCYEESEGNFRLGPLHRLACRLCRHRRASGWKLNPEGRINAEEFENTAAPESAIQTWRKSV